MERIGESVRRAAIGTSQPDLGLLTDVARAWPEAVGDAIARAAWPARIGRDGTLHVATTSSTWAFELTGLAAQISERLAAALGPAAPTAFRFAPGPVPEPPAEHPAATASAVSPSEGERSAGVALASVIEDETLRETVARAAAASLAKQRSGRTF